MTTSPLPLPDRLSTDPQSKHYVAAVFEHDIGIRFNGKERQDVEEFFAKDVEGSEIIYRLANNSTLNRLLRGLNKQALRYRYFAYTKRASTVSLSMAGTDRILKAIASGQARDARQMTEQLIDGIWREMRPVLQESFGST